jgi:Putative zinc-finger
MRRPTGWGVTACDDVRAALTAYLEGELSPDRGTVIRGHLRTCASCRVVATQEAALRDGLRALPTIDPPAAMWASIQAQLAAGEVAESRRPAWRRLVSRWTPALPRLAAVGMLAAALAGVVWWRTRPQPAATEVALIDVPSPTFQASTTPPRPLGAACDLGPSTHDVTADLAADAERVTTCYAATAGELRALVDELRPRWSDAQRAAFDARVGELRAAVDAAAPGRARQRAWRAMSRYLQSAVVRDDVVLANAGGTR